MTAAKNLRALLEKDFNLKPFVMTTGSHGLHLIIPIKRDATFTEVRACARAIGQILIDEYPGQYYLESAQVKKTRQTLY